MKCPLCSQNAILFSTIHSKEYYRCGNCFVIFLSAEFYISREKEKLRYQLHNNNVNDKGYQAFVNPIVQAVLTHFSKASTGLDFGSGTAPVITKLLRDQNYNLTTYDLYFDNNKKALQKSYDFIVCCEVIEHLKKPFKTFQLLKSLLNPYGSLLCMTHIYNETINFENWYYKNDETHIIFYHKESLKWIKNTLGFSNVTVQNRLVVFNL